MDPKLRKLVSWWSGLPEYIKATIYHQATWSSITLRPVRHWEWQTIQYHNPIVIGG